MKISIIIPSCLKDYHGAAKDRDKKIIRAIDSALNQTYEDIEIIVVADNCKKTVQILENNYRFIDNLKGYLIETNYKTWSGYPRNTGIHVCTGEYICYLDIDDQLEPTHVENIVNEIKKDNLFWYFFNDKIWDKKLKVFRERHCQFKLGHCGTQNICHKKSDKYAWKANNKYGYDDWYFIQELIKSNESYRVIGCGGNIVCHIPGQFDV